MSEITSVGLGKTPLHADHGDLAASAAILNIPNLNTARQALRTRKLQKGKTR